MISKKRRQNRRGVKRLLAMAAAVLLAAAGLAANMLYTKKYDYRHLLPAAAAAAESDFVSLGEGAAPGMQLAARNDDLELSVDPATGAFAVRVAATGALWFSNPPDAEDDPLAGGIVRDALRSQLEVSYYDAARQEKHYYSHPDSTAKGQLAVRAIPGGVRLYYTLGEVASAITRLPKYITPERLQTKVLDKLTNDRVIRAITQYYDTHNAIEGFLRFQEAALSSEIVVERMLRGFEEAGYTDEDLAYDNELSGAANERQTQYAVVPLELLLDGGRLRVSVLRDGIVEAGGIRLRYVHPLPYFGAGSAAEDGALLLPNGSGSIIRFNNGKVNQEPYLQPVYGQDLITAGRYQVQNTQDVRLPVFGIDRGEAGGLFARITQNAALAEITAEVSGRTTSYNAASPLFMLRTSAMLDLSSSVSATGTAAVMTIVDDQMALGDMTVEYSFLPPGQSAYSDMAALYRAMLRGEGTLRPLEGGGPLPFYLDVVGLAERDAHFLGIGYTGGLTMTTYEQAGWLLDALEGAGVSRVNLRYRGWFNKGINNRNPKAVQPIASLGDIGQALALDERLQSGGGALFPDVALQRIAYLSRGYWPAKDSARYLDGYNVVVADYDPVMNRMATRYSEAVYHVVSPNVLHEIAGGFRREYDRRVGLDTLALRDLGSLLVSDKNRRYPIDRGLAQRLVVEQLAGLADGRRLMVAGGNEYALAYSQTLVDVPATADRYGVVDEAIPFYQMVLHGSADYAGPPANLTEGYNYTDAVLHMIEYGLSPHYLLTWRPSGELEYTAYKNLYATGYEVWLDEAAAAYAEVDAAIGHLRGREMARHVLHAPGVREMVYQGGASVIVNYTYEEATVDGAVVPGRSYRVKMGSAGGGST